MVGICAALLCKQAKKQDKWENSFNSLFGIAENNKENV